MNTSDSPKTFLGLSSFVAVICLVAFLASGLLYARLWPDAPVVTNDTQLYLQLARDMSDGHIDELSDRTPGYPALLLLSGSHETPTLALFYIQLVLHFFSIYLGLVLLHQLKVGRMWQFLFLFVSLLPMYAEKAGYALTENFTQFLLVAGVVGLILWLRSGRWGWLILSGGALAWAGITRPTYQILGVGFGVALALLAFLPSWREHRNRALTSAGVLIVLSALLVGGLIQYNASHFGFAGLTPLSGLNLSAKTARVLERLPDSYSPVREILIKHRDEGLVKPGSAHTGAGYIWEPATINELESVTGMDRIQLSHYMTGVNLYLIRAAPLEYITEVGYAFVTYWFPANNNLANLDSRLVQLLWSLIHFLFLGFFLAQALLSIGFAVLLLILPKSNRSDFVSQIPEAWSVGNLFLFGYAVVALTAAASTVIQSGDARFRVPTDMLIWLVAIVGWNMLLHIRQALRERLAASSVSLAHVG